MADRPPAWYDDDAFWRDNAPVLFPEARWASAAEQVDAVMATLDIEPGGSILDVPCGPGRHALELARRGFAVTGVDRTRAYLDEAERRAADERLTVNWVEADMRTFDVGGGFDLVLNLFTSFGYFVDPAEDVEVARRFLAALKPGGRLVMDLMSKEVLASRFRERDWSRTEDGGLMLEERQLRSGWDWIDVTWTLMRDHQRTEHSFGHRLYSASELKMLLSGVGFVEVESFGTLAGGPYDHTAQRLVMKAHKPV